MTMVNNGLGVGSGDEWREDASCYDGTKADESGSFLSESGKVEACADAMDGCDVDAEIDCEDA